MATPGHPLVEVAQQALALLHLGRYVLEKDGGEVPEGDDLVQQVVVVGCRNAVALPEVRFQLAQLVVGLKGVDEHHARPARYQPGANLHVVALGAHGAHGRA